MNSVWRWLKRSSWTSGEMGTIGGWGRLAASSAEIGPATAGASGAILVIRHPRCSWLSNTLARHTIRLYLMSVRRIPIADVIGFPQLLLRSVREHAAAGSGARDFHLLATW